MIVSASGLSSLAVFRKPDANAVFLPKTRAGPLPALFSFVTIVLMRYLIGIDEAGRGPLAGPVSVGAMMVPGGFDFSIVAGVRDSKKLSPKAREEHYKKIFELKEAGSLDFAVEFSSPQYIDTQGIVPAINSALARCLEKLTEVGSLYT